jgi:hypothetical protein
MRAHHSGKIFLAGQSHHHKISSSKTWKIRRPINPPKSPAGFENPNFLGMA